MVAKRIEMRKRILTGGIVAVVLTVILILLLLRNTRSFNVALAAEAVPSNAIVFIDKVDFRYFADDFQDGCQLWSDLLSYARFHKVDTLIKTVRVQAAKMPILEERLMNNGLSLSMHLLGKSNLSLMYYITLGEDISPHDVEAEISGALAKYATVEKRKYEAVDLMDVTFHDSDLIQDLSYAIKDKILIISTSSILLEDAIRSLNSEGGIFYQKGFGKVAGTSGKYVLGNLYLNYTVLNHLFHPLVSNQWHNGLLSLAHLADWGEFDIDMRDNAILLNGMTYAEDSMKGWLNLFKGQSQIRLEAPAYVPSNAIEFMAMGISNKNLFINEFKRELKKRGEFQLFQIADDRHKKILGESALEDLLDLVKDEIVWFTYADNTQGNYHEVTMFQVRSRSEAEERLTRWVGLFANEMGKNSDAYTSSYVLDDDAKFTIYQFPKPVYDRGIAARFIKSYFAFYDNYLIFSDSKEAISRTIYQNVLQKTLKNERYFEQINQLLSSKANLTYFMRPEQYLARQSHMLTSPVARATDSMLVAIRKVPGVIVQFANEGEMFYSNISLNYSSFVKEKALTEWESLLDSTAIIKPHLVTNHYTSEKEILVQDAKNSLYLVNQAGRVLWKIRLDGPVMSEIYQVDYYNNGKLQYIFNTEKGIHLLDREGNYVERYPVKLRADATNGIALFDYDKRREYRIFVACDDRRVYAYDLEGSIVQGWTFKRTEDIVHKPVQHFRIGDKDYIVFSDAIRTYMLDRTGKERIKMRDEIVVSENNLLYLDMNISGGGPRFVTTDTRGNVIGISTEGTSEIILKYDATPGHYFRIKDLNRDGNPEFIFADENDLEVIDILGKKLFSFNMKSRISTLPDIYQFSSTDLKIGLTDAGRNLIYLLNADGTVYEGFPLEGNTRYSIGYFARSDSRFNLIVGGQNGFLYNYSIE